MDMIDVSKTECDVALGSGGEAGGSKAPASQLILRTWLNGDPLMNQTDSRPDTETGFDGPSAGMGVVLGKSGATGERVPAACGARDKCAAFKTRITNYALSENRRRMNRQDERYDEESHGEVVGRVPQIKVVSVYERYVGILVSPYPCA